MPKKTNLLFCQKRLFILSNNFFVLYGLQREKHHNVKTHHDKQFFILDNAQFTLNHMIIPFSAVV